MLFRDATALETLSRVNTLVIDKTGTLTKGEPKLIELITTSDVTESELLARVASLEQYSEHPLAEALVGSARERKLKLQDATNFKTVVGLGVEGDVGGERIYVGSDRLYGECRYQGDRVGQVRRPDLYDRVRGS